MHDHTTKMAPIVKLFEIEEVQLKRFIDDDLAHALRWA